jgi:hypothetical protein
MTGQTKDLRQVPSAATLPELEEKAVKRTTWHKKLC